MGFGAVAAMRAPKLAVPTLAVTPIYYQATTTTRGRCYLYHGFTESNSAFSSGVYNQIVTGLQANGWQCVAVGELYDTTGQSAGSHTDFTTDPGSAGSRFRSEVVALHQQTRYYVQDWYGPPVGGKDLVLGISWGGMMATLLAQSLPLRGFVAHLPATDPTVMTEFFGLSSRTDTCSTTNGSPIVLDPSSQSTDQGKAITGTGIPPTTYIGTWSANVDGLGNTGFRLSSTMSSQTDVNASATNASIGLAIGGLPGLHLPAAGGMPPGWISYGTADERVGHYPTEFFAQSLQALNSGITIAPQAGEAHSTTSQNATDMVAWVTANIP